MPFVIALLLGAQDPNIDLRAEAWYPRISGRMQFGDRPAVGDPVDLRSDLGADASVGYLVGFGLNFGPDRVGARFARLAFDSEGTLDQPRFWNEELYPAGEPLRFRFFLQELAIEYERLVVREANVSLSLGLSARYFRFTPVVWPSSGSRNDDTLIALLPAMSIHPRWQFASAFALAAPIELTFWRTSYIDARRLAAEAAVLWQATGALSLKAGYRVEWMRFDKDVTYERNVLSALLGGLTLGMEARF